MTGRSHLIRSVSAACLFIACLWVGAVMVLWAGQSHLVFMTGLSRQYTSALDPAIFSEHAITGPDGLRISAVSIRTNVDPDRYWIFYCPPAGASTQVQLIQHQLRALSSLRYNVFAFDYRGFGDSAGTATEEGLYADALTALSLIHI